VARVDAAGVTIACGSLHGLPSTLAGRVDVGTPRGARRLLQVGATESTVAAWPGAAPGDEVAVWGQGDRGESTATDLAEALGTVGEEVMVRLSPRIPRVDSPAG
jgi:alanine racemase